jgi:PAS domain S-box-containing protein
MPDDVHAVRAATFDEMLDAVLVADDERHYVDVNPAACELLGRTRDELLSMRVDDVLPTGTADVGGLWREFLREGSQAGEFTLERHDGRTVAIEFRARANVTPGRHVSVLRDVTARVDFGRAADRARAVLDATIMAAPVGFALLDRELRFQSVNPVLAAMNGVSMADHIGKTPMEILPGISAEILHKYARMVLETGQQQCDLELEGETPAAPGVRRTWVEHWFPVRVDEDIVGVGVLVEEVTEKRQAAARVRAAAELRERLMAIVSHDLRNPLSAIVGAASIVAMNREAPAPVHGMAQRILAASRRMQRLVEQLLDFARIDQAGALGLERVTMDLSAAAHRAADELGLALPESVVRIETHGSAVGQWDEDRMLQVLSNLIGNAIEHGRGTVDVHIDGRDPEKVRLDVCNQAARIDPEMVAILFEPFQRATSGYTRRAGLGLGLFITKSIVDAHGGSVEVRSGDDETTFTVVLPRR